MAAFFIACCLAAMPLPEQTTFWTPGRVRRSRHPATARIKKGSLQAPFDDRVESELIACGQAHVTRFAIHNFAFNVGVVGLIEEVI